MLMWHSFPSRVSSPKVVFRSWRSIHTFGQCLILLSTVSLWMRWRDCLHGMALCRWHHCSDSLRYNSWDCHVRMLLRPGPEPVRPWRRQGCSLLSSSQIRRWCSGWTTLSCSYKLTLQLPMRILLIPMRLPLDGMQLYTAHCQWLPMFVRHVLQNLLPRIIWW